MGSPRSGIRWREDTGWEFRCSSCAKNASTQCYWPLTDEFWDKRSGMSRCRACTKIAKNIRDRARYARDMTLRARRQGYAKRYRVEAADGIRVKRRMRSSEDAMRSRLDYWKDPETKRARARAYYQRNKDVIRAKRRDAYWQKQAEARAA